MRSYVLQKRIDKADKVLLLSSCLSGSFLELIKSLSDIDVTKLFRFCVEVTCFRYSGYKGTNFIWGLYVYLHSLANLRRVYAFHFHIHWQLICYVTTVDQS